MRIKLLAGVIAMNLVAFVAIGTPAIASSTPGSLPTYGSASVRMVPISGVQPDNAHGTNGHVTIDIVGSGLYVAEWTTTIGPLIPGECTEGVFWVDNEILWTGGYVCNNTDTLSNYFAQIGDIQFYTPSQVCNTALGLSGRPCEEVS